jgi:16S rRNA (cytosine967-C5)-methyltransferase
MTGRQVLIGALRDTGMDPESLFTGESHAPAPLTAAEQSNGRAPSDGAEAADLPDWLWLVLLDDLSGDATQFAQAQRERAPVALRVNERMKPRREVVDILSKDGIQTVHVPDVPLALIVTEGHRKVRQCTAYLTGLVELQDVSSQAAMAQVPVRPGDKVLDFCAGGGGKTLALAARCDAIWFAHDAAPERMMDLPERARRAGATVNLLRAEDLVREGSFDVVLCDVPCSGSGTWRRTPDAKWRLTPERLSELVDVQRKILKQAGALVAPGGYLVYTTCSILTRENEDQLAWAETMLSGLKTTAKNRWPVSREGDGFFLSIMERAVGEIQP